MNEPNPVAGPRDKALISRLITAAIGIPLVIAVTWSGGLPFMAVCVLLAFLGLRELILAARAAGSPLMVEMAYPALALIMGTLMWVEQDWIAGGELWRGLILLNVVLAAVPILLLLRAVFRYSSARPVSLSSVALTLMALMYVALFGFLAALRLLPGLGGQLFLTVLLGVWAGDTVAYFTGRAWGRQKITALSPGKTWAGTFWGFAATIVVCFFIGISWFTLLDNIGLCLIIGITAPLGDLVESFWKRELKVKELGGVLPGHGGILDRCDSLMLAGFFTFVFALWRIIP